MKILVDENIPLSTVADLRVAGHEVLDLRGTEHEGSTDEVLWQMAQGGKRLLITTDKGFAGRRTEKHCGILIVRLRQPNRRKIHERVLQAVEQIPAADWPGLLMVMRDEVQSLWCLPEED